MNKLEKMSKIEAMKGNPRISDFTIVDEGILKDNKECSEWYGGDIISMLVDNRYRVTITANGDVEGSLYVPDALDEIGYEEIRIKDRCNYGELGYELSCHNVTCDDDFCLSRDFFSQEEMEESVLQNKRPIVFLDYSNWFEFFIYDEQAQKHIANDVIDDFDEIFNDPSELIDWYVGTDIKSETKAAQQYWIVTYLDTVNETLDNSLFSDKTAATEYYNKIKESIKKDKKGQPVWKPVEYTGEDCSDFGFVREEGGTVSVRIVKHECCNEAKKENGTL